MVRWLRWHCPPDTGFEVRALAVWGRARYLSVTEAPHNIDFHTWMGKKHFCFLQTAETGNRAPNSGVKGSGANHYPRAPALCTSILNWARRISPSWCDEWDDTALQTHDSKFSDCLKSSTLPLGLRGSPQYWIFTSERRRNTWFLLNFKARVSGVRTAIFNFLSRQL